MLIDPASPAVLDLVCSIEEAAALLGVSPERAMQFCREGRLASRRLGRDWVVVRAAAKKLAKIPRPPGPKPPKSKREKEMQFPKNRAKKSR